MKDSLSYNQRTGVLKAEVWVLTSEENGSLNKLVQNQTTLAEGLDSKSMLLGWLKTDDTRIWASLYHICDVDPIQNACVTRRITYNLAYDQLKLNVSPTSLLHNLNQTSKFLFNINLPIRSQQHASQRRRKFWQWPISRGRAWYLAWSRTEGGTQRIPIKYELLILTISLELSPSSRIQGWASA